MEKQIKFTSDGKKVVVIGSLNNRETIVQEIFVVDGSEIPSGEHFVVRSLHDVPAVSWKEKELESLNREYEKKKNIYESETEKLKEKSKELRAKLNYIGSALKNANEEAFNTFVDYVTGRIKWIVVNHYDYQLLSIDEFDEMYKDKLRLISIFGKDDGSFTYAIGDYCDFSGGNKKFIPFENYDDALFKLKELVINSDVNEKNVALAKKYSFELCSDKINAWRNKRVEILNKNIKGLKEQISKQEQEVNNIINT